MVGWHHQLNGYEFEQTPGDSEGPGSLKRVKHDSKWTTAMYSCVWCFVTSWTIARQVSLFMEFPGQEYWSGLPCPPPGDPPDPWIESASLHLLPWQANRLPPGHLGSPSVLFFFFFFLFFFFICSEFCHTLKWNGLGFTCLPHPDPPSHLPLYPLPPGLPRAPGPSASHASNLGWWSVSPLIVYMFRCCSLDTSHPRLLP